MPGGPRPCQTWAVVGLRDNPARAAYGVAQFLQRQGKRIVPVHHQPQDVLRRDRPTARLADIPHPVDVVDVFVNSSLAGDIADQAVADRRQGRLVPARGRRRGGRRAGARRRAADGHGPLPRDRVGPVRGGHGAGTPGDGAAEHVTVALSCLEPARAPTLLPAGRSPARAPGSRSSSRRRGLGPARGRTSPGCTGAGVHTLDLQTSSCDVAGGRAGLPAVAGRRASSEHAHARGHAGGGVAPAAAARRRPRVPARRWPRSTSARRVASGSTPSRWTSSRRGRRRAAPCGTKTCAG